MFPEVNTFSYHEYPTTNGGMKKWKLGWNLCTLHTRFRTFGADLHARSVLINEISASEPSQKFTKSALLVGCSNEELFACLS